MEPILSKEEITDLLAAIKSGDISTDSVDAKPTQPPRFLLAQEMDLVQTYQKKSSESENRIPNFDLIIDMLARNIGTSFTNTLQRTFQVERTQINASSFQQSLLDLNNQGAVGIFSTDPLKYGCLFHFDSSLAFILLEIMLGSSEIGESIALDRTLTTIEISILKSTMVDIARDMEKAFKPVATMKPSLTKIENNFRLVNIVEADTEVLIATFNVSVSNEQAGQIRFIIPYLTLEPYREKFKEIVTITQAATGWRNFFENEAMKMGCAVIARSGLIDMTIRDILNLKPGDIIDLGYDPDQPLQVVVEEEPKFLAIPGERNGKKAFHITKRYDNSRLGEIHGTN